ncbi:MAG: indole-3-glycerol-phosphate synthase, partial [Leptospiraceae bacterium]|nr:indole-3-glycerol-phosphate synthase [Leptospiraceae bacterium]
LDDLELKQLIAAGRKWGMEPLVEVATEKELSRALEAGAQIIGINNRDLHTLEMDMTRAPRLAEKIPAQKREQLVLVAESGYSEREQLLALPHYFDAVLMGTAFMEHGQPEKKLAEIFGPAQRR